MGLPRAPQVVNPAQHETKNVTEKTNRMNIMMIIMMIIMMMMIMMMMMMRMDQELEWMIGDPIQTKI